MPRNVLTDDDDESVSFSQDPLPVGSPPTSSLNQNQLIGQVFVTKHGN